MASSKRKPFFMVTYEEWVPWTRVVPQRDGSVRITGPMGNLLDILSNNLQFNYELIRSPEKVWGGPDKNGNWNGMLGMLQREEAEFAVGPFTITSQRETISDMSVPLSGANKAMMMERPRLRTDMAGFLKAFTLEVWLLTAMSMLAISCATIVLVKAEGRVFGRVVKNVYSHTILWVLKSVTQESSVWLPPHDAGQVLVTTWLLASLVFMSSYSGILTAMLTLPRVTIPIDSLADLVAQDDLPWKLEGGTSLHQYFREAKSGVQLEVYRRLGGTFKDCWEARQEVVDGKYVALCDDTTIIKVMAWDFGTTGDCHIYMARESVISSVWMGVAFRRNSSYIRQANRVIRMMTEAGLVQHWLNEEIGSVPQCLRPPSADRSDGIAALNFEAFSGPLLVLAGGDGMSRCVMNTLLVRGNTGWCRSSVRSFSRFGSCCF
ncbi:glutamate receptor ionotropic, delta-2-like isoform X1 [Scylla paramamosain]|uniref:glutamate receptor ionotropic, delta-2-like isoform X1 n=1 Tax=Scylla paramamosain TaxID=85552 RepID=UPI003082A0B2